ncbi:fibronectin type 3 and ankyrin repeat domains 1 protein-like [Patella vulgata]|uniref:fibronectin type 3 and ankyrin repeat domains 1 protein-like n=1 Tax=Patella vulgata TaxID=6465 RepID=UPI0024A98B2C|nr:fibronectin type 3 and ankyrin repeat domains 1 protein-like [Patella vulgata]
MVVFQLLISKGFDINKLNSSNETPLYLAVCKRNKEMVKSLINSNCDVNIKEGTVSKSILSVAIQIAETTIAKMLIKAGCDVNSTDKNGVTPLMECVTNDNQSITEVLLKAGANVNHCDKSRQTPLMNAYHAS